MTKEEMIQFAKEENEKSLRFDPIKSKRSRRADIHAFLLLDELVPGNDNMVLNAEHDKIWLEVELSELAKVVTKEQIVELVHCGVMFDDVGLSMYV